MLIYLVFIEMAKVAMDIYIYIYGYTLLSLRAQAVKAPTLVDKTSCERSTEGITENVRAPCVTASAPISGSI